MKVPPFLAAKAKAQMASGAKTGAKTGATKSSSAPAKAKGGIGKAMDSFMAGNAVKKKVVAKR
jgi:hypothetical protein